MGAVRLGPGHTTMGLIRNKSKKPMDTDPMDNESWSRMFLSKTGVTIIEEDLCVQCAFLPPGSIASDIHHLLPFTTALCLWFGLLSSNSVSFFPP